MKFRKYLDNLNETLLKDEPAMLTEIMNIQRIFHATATHFNSVYVATAVFRELPIENRVKIILNDIVNYGFEKYKTNNSWVEKRAELLFFKKFGKLNLKDTKIQDDKERHRTQLENVEKLEKYYRSLVAEANKKIKSGEIDGYEEIQKLL